MVQISPEIKGGKIIPLVTGNRGENLKPNGRNSQKMISSLIPLYNFITKKFLNFILNIY